MTACQFKNFDVLAFDWSINFQMSFVEQGLECKVQLAIVPPVFFFFNFEKDVCSRLVCGRFLLNGGCL